MDQRWKSAEFHLRKASLNDFRWKTSLFHL
jgi:hypothetical protein